MSMTIEAIYESGVFKPVEPLGVLSEHQRITLTIHDPRPTTSHPLAAAIGIMPDDDAREMMRIIDDEFGRVDPDDWK